jgi:hypothetical protein
MNKIALVIGINDYESISPLSNTENDANDIADFLQEVGFKLTKLINPTQRELIEGLSKFKLEINEDTVSIIYYAGHGIQVDGENFLIPKDAVIKIIEEIPYFCVHASDCLPKQQGLKSSMHILILDACRNNPFKVGFRSMDIGLAKMTAPMGTLIAFATSPGCASIEKESDRNGIYTLNLLKHLRTPNLSIERIFKNTRTDVINATNSKQIPWEESSLHGEDFYFIKVPTALNLFIKKELIFAFKALTEDKIEMSIIEHDDVKKEYVPFSEAIKLFKQQYEANKNTIHPRDAFMLLFNLQKLILASYKFIMITRNIDFKELDKMVLQHSKELSDKEIAAYQKIILTMQHYGSIFQFNDKFGGFKSIQRQIEKHYWMGLKLEANILENQQKIMDDLEFVRNNEIHLKEIIECDILIGVMNEFFEIKTPHNTRYNQ